MAIAVSDSAKMALNGVIHMGQLESGRSGPVLIDEREYGLHTSKPERREVLFGQVG